MMRTKRRTYPRISDGSEKVIKPGTEYFKVACCDCGMVHSYFFDIKDGDIHLIIFRESASTAQLRRNEFGSLHEGVGKWKLIRNDNPRR